MIRHQGVRTNAVCAFLEGVSRHPRAADPSSLSPSGVPMFFLEQLTILEHLR